jgi:hypothetical protein
VPGFLIWLSGANKELLADFRGDRVKYEGLGGVVLMTSTMAALSAGLALNLALQANVFICIAVGLAWGLAIMNLDRWLISAFPRQDKWWKNVVQALPRFFMALIIGLVVSTPLVLRLFDHEIEQQIDEMHQVSRADFERKVKALYNVDGWQKKVDEDHAYIDAGPFDPRVKDDASVLRVYRPLAQTRAELDKLEQTGGNSGQIAQLRARESSQEANYNSARTNRVSYLHTTGKNNLRGDEAALKRARTLQAERLKEYQGNVDRNRGLLTRISALQDARDKDTSLAWAYGVLWAFITMIEVLPVLGKLMLSLGKKTPYDMALETDNEERLAYSQEKIKEKSKQKLARMRAQTRVVEAQLNAEEEAATEEVERTAERVRQRRSGSAKFGP